jgi:hypothetical protein
MAARLTEENSFEFREICVSIYIVCGVAKEARNEKSGTGSSSTKWKGNFPLEKASVVACFFRKKARNSVRSAYEKKGFS